MGYLVVLSSVLAVAWLIPISDPISTPIALIVATIASVSFHPQTLPSTPIKVASAGKAINPAHFRVSYALDGRKYVLSSIIVPPFSVLADYSDDDQRYADNACDCDCSVHGFVLSVGSILV
jgi:hypothetical protein